MEVSEELKALVEKLKQQREATYDAFERLVLSKVIASINSSGESIWLQKIPTSYARLDVIVLPSNVANIPEDEPFTSKKRVIEELVEEFNTSVSQYEELQQRALIRANIRILEIASNFGSRAVPEMGGVLFSISPPKPEPNAKRQRVRE